MLASTLDSQRAYFSQELIQLEQKAQSDLEERKKSILEIEKALENLDQQIETQV